MNEMYEGIVDTYAIWKEDDCYSLVAYTPAIRRQQIIGYAQKAEDLRHLIPKTAVRVC